MVLEELPVHRGIRGGSRGGGEGGGEGHCGSVVAGKAEGAMARGGARLCATRLWDTEREPQRPAGETVQEKQEVREGDMVRGSKRKLPFGKRARSQNSAS